VHRAEDSDLILFIKDATDLETQNIGNPFHGKDKLIINNKMDLLKNKPSFGQDEFQISCKETTGVDQLLNKITNQVKNRLTSEDVLITRSRHRECFMKCIENIDKFFLYQFHVDVSIEYLREAGFWLGKITGEIDLEEILDVVFKEFCIGK
jgi:tRNA modification GTPase